MQGGSSPTELLESRPNSLPTPFSPVQRALKFSAVCVTNKKKEMRGRARGAIILLVVKTASKAVA
jgi:hypothetical protein